MGLIDNAKKRFAKKDEKPKTTKPPKKTQKKATPKKSEAEIVSPVGVIDYRKRQVDTSKIKKFTKEDCLMALQRAQTGASLKEMAMFFNCDVVTLRRNADFYAHFNRGKAIHRLQVREDAFLAAKEGPQHAIRYLQIMVGREADYAHEKELAEINARDTRIDLQIADKPIKPGYGGKPEEEDEK